MVMGKSGTLGTIGTCGGRCLAKIRFVVRFVFGRGGKSFSSLSKMLRLNLFSRKQVFGFGG